MTTDATRSATYREILQQPEIWTGWSQDFAADAARLKAWIAGLDITELDQHLAVIECRPQFVEEGHLPLERGLVAQDLLDLLAVVPQRGVAGALL